MKNKVGFFLKFLTRFACLLAFLKGTQQVAAQSVDMDLVSSRICQNLSVGLSDATTIQSYQTSLRPDGTWADIDYASTAQSYWPPRLHLARVKAMAQAHRWDATLQGNTTLRDQILLGFDAWISRDPQSTNWWYQAIGTPQALGEILLLMDDVVTPARRAAGVALIARSYVPRATNSGTNTGSNRVERSYATLMRGLLTDDAALTSEAFLSMGDTVLVNSAHAFAEGIQPDGSFQQHGAQLYDAGYGYGYCQSMLKIASWGNGTTFAFGNRQTRVLLDYLLDGPQWMVRGDTIDYTSYGRGIARPSSGSMALGYDFALDKALTICGDYRRAEFLAFRARVAAAAVAANPAIPLTGNRNFWKSDFMVHHRPSFAISVKTSSTRTLQPECGNGEGLKNLHLADGVTLIQRTGNEYDDIMPAWDWRRLPGTTTEQGTYSLKPSADWGVYGTSTHAGGVSDGTNGAAAFAYNRLGVSAKKSWFFLGDVMVALGAGINASTATAPVITTLNQTRLSGSVIARTSNGTTTLSGTATPAGLQWVYHDGMGYFFPNAVSNGTMAAKRQTGDWQSINSSFGADPVSVDVFSLQLNHGTAVNGASYAYIVAPCLGAGAMSSFPQGNYEILQNDASIQAVKDKNAGITCANFWASGSVDGLTSSAKACVMVTRGSEFIDIALSDPTQSNTGTITLELNSPVAGIIRADSGLTVIQTSPTLRLQLSAASSYGMTFKARFYKRSNAYETISLEPVADAYAYDAAPNTNYGQSPDLVSKLITTSTGWTRESFLRFDLSSLDRVPVAASLRLMPKTVQIPGIHSVQSVPEGSWTEAGLTWNNRPNPNGPAVAFWRPVSGTRTSIDVLPVVSARATGELNLMLATFAPTSDGTVTYGSSESVSASERPVLELVLPRPEMPTIAMPVNGATVSGVESAVVLALSIPLGQSPQVTWSVVSGVGAVAFADAHATKTSARFSLPGAYVLQCASTVGAVTDLQQVLVNVIPTTDVAQVLQMKLDEAVGTSVADSVGGNTGTMIGGVAWQTAGGELAGAAAFNGTNGYIQVPDAPSLDVTSAFTLAFRFRMDSLVTNCGLVSKRVTFSSENAFSTFIDSAGRLNVDVDTNNNRFTSNTVFGTGMWHQVTLVFDGSLPSAQRVRLYVNGVLDKTAAETSASIPNSSGALVIGSLNGALGPFFNGRMDDVRLHKRVLEEWEIKSIWGGKYAPLVSPGSAPSATTGFPVTLAGEATDLITGSLSTRWSLSAGTGAAVFDDASKLMTTATFDRFGQQMLRLEVTNSVATVFREMSVVVAANSNFWADWQGQHWPGVSAEDVVSPNADPDRDGLLNLVEWACGLDPKNPDASPCRISANGAELGFDYQLAALRQGVTCVVEVSDDLSPGSWTSEGVKLVRIQQGDPEQWRATCATPPRDHRFFRIRIAKP